jgi:hypothetical protein
MFVFGLKIEVVLSIGFFKSQITLAKCHQLDEILSFVPIHE